MIKSCVIGLSKIGQIHCNNLKKIKITSLNFVYDKDQTLRNNAAKKFKCQTSNSFEEILKNKEVKGERRLGGGCSFFKYRNEGVPSFSTLKSRLRWPCRQAEQRRCCQQYQNNATSPSRTATGTAPATL